MSQPPEILVHISAPSRLSDDARYRAQALSFLSFEPVRRHGLTAKDGAPSLNARSQRSRIAGDTSKINHSPQPPLEDHQTAASLPQVLRSFTSLPPQPTSWDHNSTSHIPETTIKPPIASNIHIQRTPFPPTRPRTAPNDGPSSTIQETPFLHRSASDSWTTPPSVIPDSQPTPAGRGKRRLSSSPSPTHRSSPIAKRQRALPSSKARLEAAHALPARKPILSPPPPVRSSSPLPLLTSPPRAPADSPSLFRPTSTTIRPPRPPVSSVKFKTHLTPELSAIAAKPQLQGYYERQVREQTRDIKFHERGFWLVPLKRMAEEEKGVLWEFLGRLVGGGKAGWGTHCTLERMGKNGHEIELEGIEGGEKEEEEVVLKVYCWGEVVAELWNVLFLGTGKKVRGSGAKWVGMAEKDGSVGEELVVWMK